MAQVVPSDDGRRSLAGFRIRRPAAVPMTESHDQQPRGAPGRLQKVLISKCDRREAGGARAA